MAARFLENPGPAKNDVAEATSARYNTTNAAKMVEPRARFNITRAAREAEAIQDRLITGGVTGTSIYRKRQHEQVMGDN